jgi:uncharacterized membrane protein
LSFRAGTKKGGGGKRIQCEASQESNQEVALFQIFVPTMRRFDMPVTIKSVNRGRLWLNQVVALVLAAGTFLVMFFIVVNLGRALVAGGVDVNIPDSGSIDPSIRYICGIVLLGPAGLVYGAVRHWLNKRVMQRSGVLDIPSEVQQLYDTTKAAWASHTGKVPEGSIGEKGLPELGDVGSGSLIKSKALRTLFETCDLESNEFLVAVGEVETFVLTNKRLLLVPSKEQISLSHVVSLEQVGSYVKGGIKARLKTVEGTDIDVPAGGKSKIFMNLLEFALAMRDWSVS